MVTLRYDSGRRGLRFRASTPVGVALLVAGYLLLWGLTGQRLSRAEAERAIRTHLAQELNERQRTEGVSGATDEERVARRAAQRAALDSVVFVRLDLRHSLLDRPLSSRVRFLAHVRLVGPVQPSERYYALRISGIGMAPYAVEAARWEWMLRF